MKIFVVTHKQIDDKNTSIRQKLQVGKPTKDIDYINDNTGDNIAEKNPFYCELTALYWIWKNSKEDIIGLEHYRRKFCGNKSIFSYKLLNEKQIRKYLKKVDLIVTPFCKHKLCVREEYMSGEEIGNHIAKDIDLTEEAIKLIYPDDYDSFKDYFYNQTRSNGYNMFIGKKDIMDKYCEWLFQLFDYLEKSLDDYQARPGNQKRVFGYLSERLFGYYIYKEQIKFKQCQVIYTENWDKTILIKKITGAIKFKVYKLIYFFEDKFRKY